MPKIKCESCDCTHNCEGDCGVAEIGFIDVDCEGNCVDYAPLTNEEYWEIFGKLRDSKKN